MHKTDLIKAISGNTGASQKDSGAFLDSFINSVTGALKKGDSVTVIGFGTFKTVKTSARKGRNPQTGKEITIPASTRVKFSAGKVLKDSVN